jgi:hypothetical protein
LYRGGQTRLKMFFLLQIPFFPPPPPPQALNLN